MVILRLIVSATFMAVVVFNLSPSFEAWLTLSFLDQIQQLFICISFGDSYSLVMLAMMLAGLGMGVMIPNANVWVMQLAPPEIRGREIGRLTTFWFMGQFLSPLILLPFLDWLTQSQLFFIIACFLFALSILMFGFYFATKKRERI